MTPETLRCRPVCAAHGETGANPSEKQNTRQRNVSHTFTPQSHVSRLRKAGSCSGYSAQRAACTNLRNRRRARRPRGALARSCTRCAVSASVPPWWLSLCNTASTSTSTRSSYPCPSRRRHKKRKLMRCTALCFGVLMHCGSLHHVVYALHLLTS